MINQYQKSDEKTEEEDLVSIRIHGGDSTSRLGIVSNF